MNARYLGFNPIQPLLDSNMGTMNYLGIGNYGASQSPSAPVQLPIQPNNIYPPTQLELGRNLNFSRGPMLSPATSTSMAKVVGNGIKPVEAVDPKALTVGQMTEPQLAEALAKNQPNQTYDKIGLGIQGLGVLGNIGLTGWSLWQAQKAFDFQKGMAQDNYNNSVQSYNRNVEDRIRGRYGASTDKAYIDEQVRKSQLGASGTPASSSRNASNQYSNPYTFNFK